MAKKRRKQSQKQLEKRFYSLRNKLEKKIEKAGQQGFISYTEYKRIASPLKKNNKEPKRTNRVINLEMPIGRKLSQKDIAKLERYEKNFWYYYKGGLNVNQETGEATLVPLDKYKSMLRLEAAKRGVETRKRNELKRQLNRIATTKETETIEEMVKLLTDEEWQAEADREYRRRKDKLFEADEETRDTYGEEHGAYDEDEEDLIDEVSSAQRIISILANPTFFNWNSTNESMEWYSQRNNILNRLMNFIEGAIADRNTIVLSNIRNNLGELNRLADTISNSYHDFEELEGDYDYFCSLCGFEEAGFM